MIDRALAKIILNDILKGYSVVQHKGYGKLFIKHPNLYDEAEIDEYYYVLYKKAKDAGIPNFSEKLKQAKINGSWSDNKEKELSEQKLYVEGLKKTKENLLYEDEIDHLSAEIKEAKGKIQKLEEEKFIATHPYIESWVENRIKEKSVISSFYKTPECSIDQRLINEEEEESDEIDSGDLKYLIELYSEKIINYTVKTIKRVSLEPNFISPFCLCDNDPYKFYGKPIINLTKFQRDIFTYAAKYKDIISDCKGVDIPEELLEDPEKLEEWDNKRKNLKKIIEKNQGKGGKLMIPGYSNEELKDLGFSENIADTNKMAALAKKHGGTLSFEDAIRENVI